MICPCYERFFQIRFTDLFIKMKTFVLVHGAWSGPYSWYQLTEKLKAAGHTVIEIELPGHGKNTASPESLTMEQYRDAVVKVIRDIDGKVILAGHSMGGMVISSVAELIPVKIEKLIYVTAFIPSSGQSLVDLNSLDLESLVHDNASLSEDHLTILLKKENLISILCQDIPEAEAFVQEHYHPEPIIPFTNPVFHTHDNFGMVPKYYIHALQDQAITLSLQRRMVEAAGIEHIYMLDSGHAPQLSMPEALKDILLEIATHEA